MAVIEIAVEGDDALNIRGAPGIGDRDRIAGRNRTGDHRAGVAAEVAFGSDDELHRESKAGILRGFHRFPIGKELHEGRAGVPGHVGRCRRDVVTGEGTDRDRHDLGHIQSSSGGAHDPDNLLEGGVVVADRDPSCSRR